MLMGSRRKSATPSQLGAAAAAQGWTLTDCPFIRDPDRAKWRLAWTQARDALRKTATAHRIDTEIVDGVEVAKHRDDIGTPELRQHTEFTTSEVREGGQSRKRPRTVDLPRKMRRSGFITFEMEMAWRRFNRDFHFSSFDELRAPDVARTPVSGSKVGVNDRVEDARTRVHRAIMRLGGRGSGCGLAAWHVMGEEMNIKDFAARSFFGAGHTLRPEVARGLVIGTAGALMAYYEEIGDDE